MWIEQAAAAVRLLALRLLVTRPCAGLLSAAQAAPVAEVLRLAASTPSAAAADDGGGVRLALAGLSGLVTLACVLPRRARAAVLPALAALASADDGRAAPGGESFPRVHWVAVPKALRARRVIRRLHHGGGARLPAAGALVAADAPQRPRRGRGAGGRGAQRLPACRRVRAVTPWRAG
jgi:hypothetical protein